MFLFKLYGNAQVFEVANRFQKIHGVARETGYALGQHNVNFSGFAVGKHPIELLTGCSLCTCYAVVGINTYILPTWVLLYEGAVITHLCRKGVL